MAKIILFCAGHVLMDAFGCFETLHGSVHAVVLDCSLLHGCQNSALRWCDAALKPVDEQQAHIRMGPVLQDWA